MLTTRKHILLSDFLDFLSYRNHKMVVIVIEKEERFVWEKATDSENEFKASFANQFRDTIN